MKKAAELVSKAGFQYLDYTPPVNDDNWECVMREDLKIFEEEGLKVHQTHAPFNRYGTYGERFNLCMERAMEATAAMGAKYIAVHGDEFDFNSYEFTSERAFLNNYELFRPYVEQAEKIGYKLGFETVFDDCGKRRYTSLSDELKKLILSFESKNAVCCWDFGHANVSFGKKQAEIIRDFGSLIECTHLHDNVGNDSHQMPMTGDINWTEIIPALKGTGFNGVMSVEYAHGESPLYMAEDFLKLTKKSVDYIMSL
ncbi:MAG: sugar phosphate isomerase/epimerase [Clostridia bacterium]|nr:sugar phosphate isomerase/epimerase [Clostridia bacterium]